MQTNWNSIIPDCKRVWIHYLVNITIPCGTLFFPRLSQLSRIRPLSFSESFSIVTLGNAVIPGRLSMLWHQNVFFSLKQDLLNSHFQTSRVQSSGMTPLWSADIIRQGQIRLIRGACMRDYRIEKPFKYIYFTVCLQCIAINFTANAFWQMLLALNT